MPASRSTPKILAKAPALLRDYKSLLRRLLRDAPLNGRRVRLLGEQLRKRPYVLSTAIPAQWERRAEFRAAFRRLGVRSRNVGMAPSALKAKLVDIIEQLTQQAYLRHAASRKSRSRRANGAPRSPRSARRSRMGSRTKSSTRKRSGLKGTAPKLSRKKGKKGGGGGGFRRDWVFEATSAADDDAGFGGAFDGGGGGGGGGDEGGFDGGENGGGSGDEGDFDAEVFERSRGTRPASVPRSRARPAAAANGGDEDEGLLGAAPSRAVRPAPAAVPEQPRWINAELEKHDKAKPLAVGTTYTLSFDVDVSAREETDAGVVSSEPLVFSFPKGVKRVELTVDLDSRDFKTVPRRRKLVLLPTGPSENKASFRITPLHESEGTINAIFHKDGNFIQRLTLTFRVGGTAVVGPAMTSTATGRPVSAAATAQPREISLVVENKGGEYELKVTEPVNEQAVTLAMNERQLAERVEEVRQVLLGIVRQTDATGRKVYQRGIDIDPKSNEKALRALADVGYRLYYDLFFRAGAGPGTRPLGERLRKALRGTPGTLQITSKNFPIPWGVLYLADTWDDQKPIDPRLFLGLRRAVEQLPMVTADWPDGIIVSDRPTLSVSLNVNRGIDQEAKRPLVADQIAYWNGLAKDRIKCVVRDTGDALRDALAAETADDQLVYCYCHADTVTLGPGGVNASRLLFDGGTGLSLKDLYKLAGKPSTLPNAPLVVINACESAEMSPLFYDGFVPYFMVKGARGAIGTECKTPAIFAAEWARRFFDLLLAGVTIGESVFRLRQEFYDKHNNILGMLYSVYCNGDDSVAPAVLQ